MARPFSTVTPTMSGSLRHHGRNRPSYSQPDFKNGTLYSE